MKLHLYPSTPPTFPNFPHITSPPIPHIYPQYTSILFTTKNFTLHHRPHFLTYLTSFFYAAHYYTPHQYSHSALIKTNTHVPHSSYIFSPEALFTLHKLTHITYSHSSPQRKPSAPHMPGQSTSSFFRTLTSSLQAHSALGEGGSQVP